MIRTGIPGASLNDTLLLPLLFHGLIFLAYVGPNGKSMSFKSVHLLKLLLVAPFTVFGWNLLIV
jgi:hypothetical protein